MKVFIKIKKPEEEEEEEEEEEGVEENRGDDGRIYKLPRRRLTRQLGPYAHTHTHTH